MRSPLSVTGADSLTEKGKMKGICGRSDWHSSSTTVAAATMIVVLRQTGSSELALNQLITAEINQHHSHTHTF